MGSDLFEEDLGAWRSGGIYWAAFKAKVALEASGGDRTLAELAARYKLHPNLIAKWKRQASAGMVEVFPGKMAGGGVARVQLAIQGDHPPGCRR